MTRQNLPVLKGKDEPDAILIATGSKVQLAMDAHAALKEKGIDTSVVSLPYWDRFNEQSIEYRHQVKARFGIEMGSIIG